MPKSTSTQHANDRGMRGGTPSGGPRGASVRRPGDHPATEVAIDAADRPFAPEPRVERRAVPAEGMTGVATGNAGQKAAGKIEEGVAPVTNPPGRIQG